MRIRHLLLVAMVAASLVVATGCGDDKGDGKGKGDKPAGAPEFANDRCPIMGSPINPAKVAENLIRDYKGQKVAFCCAGCPAAWDKLTDTQKQAKLTKVKPSPMQMHSGHRD